MRIQVFWKRLTCALHVVGSEGPCAMATDPWVDNYLPLR
jgi:hypothetical protein